MATEPNKHGKVYRVYSEDGQAFVDVLRFTQVYMYDADANSGEQGFWVTLDWTDGTTEAARVYEDVIVTPPSGISSSPITIKAIKKIRMYHDGQDEIWTFENPSQSSPTFRENEVIRVYGKETITPPAEGVDWEEYKTGLEGTGTGDYLDVNVTRSYRQYRQGQDKIFRFNNEDITSRFESADQSTIYLDPFQVIVNINFRPQTQWAVWPANIKGYNRRRVPAQYIAPIYYPGVSWYAGNWYVEATRFIYNGNIIPNYFWLLNDQGYNVGTATVDTSILPQVVNEIYRTELGEWKFGLENIEKSYLPDPGNIFLTIDNPYDYTGYPLDDAPNTSFGSGLQKFYSDKSVTISLKSFAITLIVTEYNWFDPPGTTYLKRGGFAIDGSEVSQVAHASVYVAPPASVVLNGDTYNLYGVMVDKADGDYAEQDPLDPPNPVIDYLDLVTPYSYSYCGLSYWIYFLYKKANT